MKVASHKSIGEKAVDTGLKAVPCRGCGRIFIQSVDEKNKECPECGGELYPIRRRVELNKELKLSGGMEVRVSQDKILRGAAVIMQALINQTTCDCTKGIRCYHCQAIAILRRFPGPEEGSLEDDWATLRGKLDKDAPLQDIPEEDRGWYSRLAGADVLGEDSVNDSSSAPRGFTSLESAGEDPEEADNRDF